MVHTASKLSLVLLAPLLLRQCLWAAGRPWARGDAHSLHYDFNITTKRQPWCKVQGQVDEKNFLSYDCGSNKVISMNVLQEEVIGTEVWTDQTYTLRHVGNLLRQQLPDIKPDKHPDSVPLTLQVRMTCQCKANGRRSASWEFGFCGHRSLLFDSENRKYSVVHPEGERIKEKWEADRELTKSFTTISTGDCGKWLQFLVRWKKLVAPTAPPETIPNTARPTKAPAAAPCKATTTTLITWTIPVILTCSIITGLPG